MKKLLVILVAAAFIFGGIIGFSAAEDTDIGKILCTCGCEAPAIVCSCEDAAKVLKEHGVVTEEQREKALKDFLKSQEGKPSGLTI